MAQPNPVYGLGRIGNRGGQGIANLDSAFPLPGGTLVVSLSGRFFKVSNFLAQGDSNTYQQQKLTITWAPIQMLEIGLSQNSVTNTNPAFDPTTTQILGDPELHLKGSYAFGDKYGAGLVTRIMFPTSPKGSGFATSAFRLGIHAVGSMLVKPWLELTLNAGVLIDNTDKLFNPNRKVSKAQRFTASIATSNQITLGLGAAGHVGVADIFAMGPFVELNSGFALKPGGAQHPIFATLGTKIYPIKAGLIEAAFGANIRITGKPINDNLPGIPPWEVFARISAHVFGSRATTNVASGGPRSCQEDSDCQGSQSCIAGNICALVHVKTEVKTVVEAPPTFSIKGTVLDKITQKPIRHATVTIAGNTTSPLASHPKTGAFESYALPTGAGLVQLTAQAPGYVTVSSPVPRGKNGEISKITFLLTALGKNTVGEVKGSLKDARTGNAIKGNVFVPQLGKKFMVGKDGKFHETLKAGRYQVLVSSGGYITQKKRIEIRAGDVVILNIDLNKRR